MYTIINKEIKEIKTMTTLLNQESKSLSDLENITIQ